MSASSSGWLRQRAKRGAGQRPAGGGRPFKHRFLNRLCALRRRCNKSSGALAAYHNFFVGVIHNVHNPEYLPCG